MVAQSGSFIIYTWSIPLTLSHRVQHPVRIMLDRNEDMLSSGGRHPFLGKYKVGFTSEGRITALDLQLYSNGGISADLSIAVSIHVHVYEYVYLYALNIP